MIIPRKKARKVHDSIHRALGERRDHNEQYWDLILGYFVDKLEKLEDAMKEVSKQQKYLWQTLEEFNEKKEVEDE